MEKHSNWLKLLNIQVVVLICIASTFFLEQRDKIRLSYANTLRMELLKIQLEDDRALMERAMQQRDALLDRLSVVEDVAFGLNPKWREGTPYAPEYFLK